MKYVFSEIPNTRDGKKLVTLMRKYLNKNQYSLRIRGQYMNEVAKKNWRKYEMGQPLSLSKCLRVYVETK